jgi:hypothetical protein
VVDLEKTFEHVGVIVTVLHSRDRELLLVGQALDAAHHGLQRGLGRLVGAGLGPAGGLAEHLRDLFQVPAVGELVQPGLERAGHIDRTTVQGFDQDGETGRDQVCQLVVPESLAAFECGDPIAQASGDPPLPQQHDQDGERGHGQATDRHRQD